MAVRILVSGLLGSSMLSFELALAATLGADLGSAQVIKFLGFLSETHVDRQIVLTHIIFNAMLLLAIPFSRLVGRYATRLLPEDDGSNEDIPAHYCSVLDKNT